MTSGEVVLWSQALVGRYQRGELSRAAYLELLRQKYHSVHASVRSQAVDLLDDLPEPERTRELMQLLQDCQWRETQMAIIRTLARQPTQRGLECLMHLACDDVDLGLCRAAITSLGRSRSPLAARYLATQYTVGPPSLKPYVAHALGELFDRTLADRFLEDLQDAIAGQQVLWTQSLVLALAELKVGACEDDFVRLLRVQPRSIALSALLALGKVAKDSALLDGAISAYGDDFVDWQIVASVRQQIELRSRWSIEDYLEGLFDLAQPLDVGLALELNRFAAADVRAGLDIFCDTAHRVRLAEVLAYVYHPDAIDWFRQMLFSQTLTDDELKSILAALQTRPEPAFGSLLLTWRDRCVLSADDALYEQWLRTCALFPPGGGRLIVDFMHDASFAKQSTARQITAINQLVDHGLSVLRDKRRLKSIVRDLEARLDEATDPQVAGRILRAFAQLRTAGTKAFVFARQHLEDPELLSSILQFFRYCRHKQAMAWLATLTARASQRAEVAVALLHAMTAQKRRAAENDADVEAFVNAALQGEFDHEACLAALHFLTCHPIPSLFDTVLDLLDAGDRMRMGVIVALKSFADARATSRLVPLLNDASESIAGRALDTLTTQPDDAARWAVLDFLETRLEDMDVVDKVIRCLTPPKQHRRAFFDRVAALVKSQPHHLMLEGLVQLRDRVAPVEPLPRSGEPLPAGVAPALDHELARRLAVFPQLDERVKAALRTAELPYFYPDMFHGDVDKSTSILEYCKAVDLVLERHLGNDLLMPKLRDDLPAFQNTIYRVGLNGSYANPVSVLDELGLRGLITPEALPIAKIMRVAQSVLDGRIQQAQWRILDGLRAWSAALLLFVRASEENAVAGIAAPIQIETVSNRLIVELALHLDFLQELRNPVAHRRTLVEFADIEMIRHDVTGIFEILGQIFFSI